MATAADPGGPDRNHAKSSLENSEDGATNELLNYILKINQRNAEETGKLFLSYIDSLTESDWVEWFGGECPVGDTFSQTDFVIEVEFRYGNTEKSSSANFYSWKHYDRPTDIIAYRIIQGQQPTNQNGEK